MLLKSTKKPKFLTEGQKDNVQRKMPDPIGNLKNRYKIVVLAVHLQNIQLLNSRQLTLNQRSLASELGLEPGSSECSWRWTAGQKPTFLRGQERCLLGSAVRYDLKNCSAGRRAGLAAVAKVAAD